MIQYHTCAALVCALVFCFASVCMTCFLDVAWLTSLCCCIHGLGEGIFGPSHGLPRPKAHTPMDAPATGGAFVSMQIVDSSFP